MAEYFDAKALAEYQQKNPNVKIVDPKEFDLLKAEFPLFIWFFRTGAATSKMVYNKKKPKHKSQQIKDIKDYSKNGSKIPFLSPGQEK